MFEGLSRRAVRALAKWTVGALTCARVNAFGAPSKARCEGACEVGCGRLDVRLACGVNAFETLWKGRCEGACQVGCARLDVRSACGVSASEGRSRRAVRAFAKWVVGALTCAVRAFAKWAVGALTCARRAV